MATDRPQPPKPPEPPRPPEPQRPQQPGRIEKHSQDVPSASHKPDIRPPKQ